MRVGTHFFNKRILELLELVFFQIKELSVCFVQDKRCFLCSSKDNLCFFVVLVFLCVLFKKIRDVGLVLSTLSHCLSSDAPFLSLSLKMASFITRFSPKVIQYFSRLNIIIRFYF